MLRSPRVWIASAAFSLAASLLSPAAGQAQAASGPIPQTTMNDMALAAAVSVCELAVEDKVAVQRSVISAAKAMTYVVTNNYGSQVAGAGRLEAEQIANGSIIQIVGRVRQGCFDRLTAADKKFVEDILNEYSRAVQNQGQGR